MPGDTAAVTLVLAHRGASRVEAENTLAAFRRAFELGADGVELDVHRTGDGGLVVHHDAVVPAVGRFAATTVAAVRDAAPWIPTLAEALDVCAGRTVNVEIKNLPGAADHDPAEAAAELVVRLLAARGHRDRVLVSSFGLPTVDRVHALDPAIPTALLTARSTDLVGALALAHDRGHRALNPRAHALVGRRAERLADRARELGMSLYVWTVNDARQMRRLAAAGVTGLITDVPDRARRVLTPGPAA
ncbi:MAG TPA: glycerophosphodiester phosphodiesterase [Acidimicrobiia bacterium]|nr:glycerophosphodiester phosphodiesterase [Acidimicrobiia bacterium]